MNAPLYELSTMDEVVQDERIGQQFCGKWTLEQLLGAGAAGAVYAARHRNGNRVAIKVALAKWAHFPQVRERFLTEARAANRVNHRAVVRVHDEGVANDGSIFLVMDLLQGQTLGEYLESHGPLSLEQVLLVAHEILEALMATHAVGVLHRDIKPGNLFMNWDGRVLLVDFGIARLAEERSLTEVGVPIGTPCFMPPEQAAGRWPDVDERADLWSLGATLFTLLSGEPVRQVASVAEELQIAATTPARSLATVLELPSSVIALVDKALALNPADRFESAAAMRDAVRATMTNLGMALPTASEFPGIRAGFVPGPSNDSGPEERHPSGIRLQLCDSTIPLMEETEQFARRVRRGPRLIRTALIPLALGAAAFTVWEPSYGRTQLANVIQSLKTLGATATLQGRSATVIPPDAAEHASRQHARLARSTVSVRAQLVESLRELIPHGVTLEALPPEPEPQTFAPRRTWKTVTPAAAELPAPFDPLAARL
jgi:serine/threonine protein kinase